MRVASLLVLLTLAGCDTFGLEVVPEQDASLEAWDEMLDAVNAARAGGGMCGTERFAPSRPLIWDVRLERAAMRHSRDMARHGFFGHVGSDGQGVGARVLEAGYRWRVVAENIAWRHETVAEVMADWLESPGHCRQMLNPGLREMGAGQARGYWTQVFAVPR